VGNVDWKTFFETVTALLSVLTVAIGLWNRAHIGAIRDEQKRVSEKLETVATNGHNLSELLQKTGREGP